MSIGYLPWNKPATVADRVCMRDTNAELTYADVALRVDAVAEQFASAGATWWRCCCPTGSTPNVGYGVPVLQAEDLNTAPVGALPAPDTGPDDLALLIYTSGSTGRPKGVMLDHANLVAMAASIGEAMKLGPDDNCLLVLPLFHVNAILVSCRAPIMVDAQVTILPRFAPGTFFAAVPAIYARLAELPADQLGDTSSVRFAVCGAAPVSRELLERSESRFGFPVVEGYALTEATCAPTVNPLDGVRKPGTVGVVKRRCWPPGR